MCCIEAHYDVWTWGHLKAMIAQVRPSGLEVKTRVGTFHGRWRARELTDVASTSCKEQQREPLVENEADCRNRFTASTFLRLCCGWVSVVSPGKGEKAEKGGLWVGWAPKLISSPPPWSPRQKGSLVALSR